MNGGLPRHLVVNVPPDGAVVGERGEFDVRLEEADLKLLPDEGTPAERVAMDFHGGNFQGGENTRTIYGFPAEAYPAFTPGGQAGLVLRQRPARRSREPRTRTPAPRAPGSATTASPTSSWTWW